MNFEEACTSLFSALGDHKVMILATCAQERPTARSMSVIINDGRFYVQTDKNMLKYKQIQANPRVALCVENIQIEGICSILEHPLEDANRFFAEAFEKHYPSSFKAYSLLEAEMFIEIKPLLITQWCYNDGKPRRKYISFEEDRAWSEPYQI